MKDIQTIPQAFAAWADTEARLYTVSQDAWLKLAERKASIEDMAVELPVRTPGELWQLLAMVAKPDCDMTSATEHLLRRAKAEASAAAAPGCETPASEFLSQWWSAYARTNAEALTGPDMDAAMADIHRLEDLILVAPAPSARDVWAKVAVLLELPAGPQHTGSGLVETALASQARIALSDLAG